MDTFCFNWNEIIPNDKSEHSVYMNAKYSDRVDVCIYMSQVSNNIYIFEYAEFPSVFTS